MFKKVLSASLCMLFLFFFSFNCVGAKSYGNFQENDTSDVVVVHVEEQDVEFSKKEIEKICKKQIKKLESEKNSKSSSQRWTNVVNHPFRIVLRAGGWGILGAFLANLLFSSSTVVFIVSSLCAICGGLSKAIDYYYNE